MYVPELGVADFFGITCDLAIIYRTIIIEKKLSFSQFGSIEMAQHISYIYECIKAQLQHNICSFTDRRTNAHTILSKCLYVRFACAYAFVAASASVATEIGLSNDGGGDGGSVATAKAHIKFIGMKSFKDTYKYVNKSQIVWIFVVKFLFG